MRTFIFLILLVALMAAFRFLGPVAGWEIKTPVNDPDMQAKMKYTITVGNSYRGSAGGMTVASGGVGFFGGRVEMKPDEKFFTSRYSFIPQGGIEFDAFDWRSGTSRKVVIEGGYTIRETDFSQIEFFLK